MSPDDPRHGTPTGRHAHTRAGVPICDPCRHAAARYEQELQLDRLAGRPRLIPSLGTQRRIQALVALGYDFRRLANALGVGQQAASRLANSLGPTVYVRTATQVATLYDAWSMTLPTTDTPRDARAASYARTNARRHGWLPPLAWDDIDHDTTPATARTAGPRTETHADPVAVTRALEGDTTVTLTRADRIAVVRRARAAGWPYAQIEEITGIPRPDRYAPDTTSTTTSSTDNEENTAA